MDIRSEFIQWVLLRTLIRREYFLLVQHTTSSLVKLSTWCFEHYHGISCSLLINPNHIDDSWEGRNTSLWIYALNFFIAHSGEHWWENKILCPITTPDPFRQRSAPGALSTIMKSVFLNSLTRATLMSPGKDETRVCGYMLWPYSLSTLENTDENRIFFIRSPHHKHFGKAQRLLLRTIVWHQLLSSR